MSKKMLGFIGGFLLFCANANATELLCFTPKSVSDGDNEQVLLKGNDQLDCTSMYPNPFNKQSDSAGFVETATFHVTFENVGIGLRQTFGEGVGISCPTISYERLGVPGGFTEFYGIKENVALFVGEDASIFVGKDLAPCLLVGPLGGVGASLVGVKVTITQTSQAQQ